MSRLRQSETSFCRGDSIACMIRSKPLRVFSHRTDTASRLLKKFSAMSTFSMFARVTGERMGDDCRHGRGVWHDFASSSALRTGSSRCGENLRDANEIVCGRRQDEEEFDQHPPAVSGFAQTADGLHPAERLFDPLALDCADAIAGMSGRTGIDRRAAIGIVLRDMWRAAAFATAGHEVSGVIVLVAAHR